MVPDVEGAPAEEPLFVEAFGRKYRVADHVGVAPMVKFAQLAKSGAGAQDLESLAVMGDLIAAVLADGEYDRYMDDATAARADGEELFAVVTQAMQVLSARPTKRPSVSSPGPLTTTPSSTESSSFEERKRALGLVPVTDALSELAG